MYRYMYSYKNILVLDFEELVVPQNTLTLYDVMQREVGLKQNPMNITHFQIHEVKLFSDESQASETSRFKLLSKKHYFPLDDITEDYKVILDPQMCILGTNGFCVKSADGAHTLTVNTNNAVAL